METPPKPNQLEAYTVVVLENQGEFLLLQRSPSKRFAPNQWTGIGGKVELPEFADLRAAALRELAEESGIQAGMVYNFSLRRVLFHNRPGSPLTVLLYYTGYLEQRVTPNCSEGSLHWRSPGDLASLEVIETTRPVLPLLIDDYNRDPKGIQPVRIGLGIFSGGGFQGIVWDNERS